MTEEALRAEVADLKTAIAVMKRDAERRDDRLDGIEDAVWGDDRQSGLIGEMKKTAYLKYTYALVVAVVMPVLTLVAKKLLPWLFST